MSVGKWSISASFIAPLDITSFAGCHLSIWVQCSKGQSQRKVISIYSSGGVEKTYNGRRCTKEWFEGPDVINLRFSKIWDSQRCTFWGMSQVLGRNCFGALQTKWAREHAWTVPQRQRSPAGCLERGNQEGISRQLKTPFPSDNIN